MIEERLVELLDSAGVTSYPGKAPESVNAPFGVYTRVTTQRVTHLSGPAKLAYTTFQIDLYHTSHSSVALLSEALRLVLDGHKDVATGIQYISVEDEADMPADPDSDGLFRRMFEVKVTHTEA